MRKVICAAVVVLVLSAGWQRAAAQDRDVKELYGEVCKKCHGVLGNPPVAMKKKFSKIATFDAKFLETHSEDSIVKILVKGKGDDMESYKGKLSPAEMQAVAKYVRELANKPKPGGHE